ncbi:hypothetical protein [Halorubrum sp. BV1]|uniref:DUF7345 domain-containing protein n=1 Tax=Halorubrum sp. BV1 TaxID=1498500 RepID=UPI0006785802|nr:hypothetical protein [Halorubrum sp. BV1]
MRNPPSRVLLAAAVGVLLLAGVFASAAGAAAASPSASPADRAAAVTGDPVIEQADDGVDPTTATRIRIEPAPDGDARWTVSVRYALTDEADRAAFETVGDRFANGEIGPSADLFAGFAREASRNLNRTMRIESAEREAIVHEDTSSFDVADEDAAAVGELRLSFVWTAFLTQDGEELVLGDALTTPDGTWLRSLEPGQTLEVTTPDGYTVTSTTASLRDNAVVIEGPRTFDEGEGVAVVYASTGTPGPPWTMLAAAIVVGALIIAGSIVSYRRRERDVAAGSDDAGASPTTADDTRAGETGASDASVGNPETSDASSGESDAGGRAADGTETPRDGTPAKSGDPTEPDAPGDSGTEPAAGASADTQTDSGPDESGPTESSDSAEGRERADEIDQSLLSDEERVEHLLVDNGGRMRQADIVSETGWSDAKVSQLLSAMTDEGRVEKLRLGRENLISLPDSGTDAAARGGDDTGTDPDGEVDPGSGGDR